MNHDELAMQMFLQVAIILAVCRVVGWIAGWFGQSQVVAEMIAGVMLGPSLLGLWFPEIQQAIFPSPSAGFPSPSAGFPSPSAGESGSQSYLYPMSQLGLALYMFVVGMEFRVEIVRQSFRSSLAVSVAGMIVPFGLGAMLAWWMLRSTSLFSPETNTIEAMLFLGASMCITAFPMLARIIHSKGLAGSRMGTVAIGAGAIDDAAAWCFLAVVLASFDGDWTIAAKSIGGGIVFVAAAVLIVKPLLNRFGDRMINTDGRSSEAGICVALICMAAGAWCTDSIQLHAVFGAFVMGAVMPRGVLTKDLIGKIEPLTVAVLLPLFFTYSGLNTKITALNSVSLWCWAGAVLVVAVLGKAVACAVAARATGLPTREAIGIGVLMNARGLMELIVINIGLQRGVISEALFAILVTMAIVTTLMASPLFDRVMPRRVTA